MYFESRMNKGGGNKRRGLPWFDSRSELEKESDGYFKALGKLVEQVDDVELDTPFMTDLDPDSFLSGYGYAIARVRELRRYLKGDSVPDDVDREDCLDQLEEIVEDLKDLEDDAILYDGIPDDDWDEDDEDDDYGEDW